MCQDYHYYNIENITDLKFIIQNAGLFNKSESKDGLSTDGYLSNKDASR